MTPTIRNRLQNFLTDHKQEMQHDYDYVALYPNRDPLPNRNQPADDSQDSQAFSQWNGIGGREPAPPVPPQRAPSVAARASNRVEEYLQGKPHPLTRSAPPYPLPCATRALHYSYAPSSLEQHAPRSLEPYSPIRGHCASSNRAPLALIEQH